MTKRCTACQKIKPLGLFSNRGASPDGRQPKCKKCANELEGRRRAASPLRSVWSAMIQRCYNPMCQGYVWYGARGITVCDRWRTDFNEYKMDIEAIGPKPSPSHSVDRIDNDDGYRPGNIRWVDKSLQKYNQRRQRNNKSGHKGISWHKKTGKWIVQSGDRESARYVGVYQDLADAVAARAESIVRLSPDRP